MCLLKNRCLINLSKGSVISYKLKAKSPWFFSLTLVCHLQCNMRVDHVLSTVNQRLYLTNSLR
jgi:hypothetical protein